MNQQLTRRDVLATAAAAGGLACATPMLANTFDPSPVDAGPATLRQRAARKGLLCGSEIMAANLGDGLLRDVLIQDANILTPGIELKWGVLQPEPNGPLRFDKAEAIYDFAHANNMQMRGHCLTWSRDEPAWATEMVGAMTPGKAGDFLHDYVTKVVGHWKGRISQWDVTNEPISAKDELIEKLFSGKLGEQYLDIAFAAAAAADPTTLLMMNHDLIAQEWWWEDKQREATLRLIERLLKRNVPLQGFGFEGHLRTAYGFSETKWRTFLDELTGMGLKLMITEFDVNDRGTLGSIAARDAATTALATAVLDVTLSYRNCLGLVTWDMVERYSWLADKSAKPRTDGTPPRGDLRDKDYKRTALWHAVAGAIDRAPPR